MSTGEAARRWRLVLGRYSERRLNARLSSRELATDEALDFLYGRLYEGRGMRLGRERGGPRDADLSESAPTMVDWLEQIRELFPEEVSERLTGEAINRFGLVEALGDPTVLERITPNQALLGTLLQLKGKLPSSVLQPVRQIVARVVEELTRQLRTELTPALSGRRNPAPTARPTGLLDPDATVARNLHTWDPERRRLLVERLWFTDRSRLRLPWDVILVIDQSGSMTGSVIHSAVLAGILSGLPGVHVKVVVFDTGVVDLTGVGDDPVELLMSVQLGGGTDIAQALRYAEGLVENPTRTVLALISDFYEGGSVTDLLACVGRLAETGATLLGLAALEDGAGPACNEQVAGQVATLGMPVGAMTPAAFGRWLLEVMG